MSQPGKKNWKAAAFAAVAEHFKLLEEKATWEERVEASKAACVKLGVDFRWDDEPQVPGAIEALVCPCGTIVPLTYDAKQLPRAPDGFLHCAACREKAARAAREDAIAEGRPDPALEKKTETKKTDTEISS